MYNSGSVTCQFITLPLLYIDPTHRYRMKFLTGYLFFIFNYMALAAVIFILIIIPLRITGSDVQWVFAALAYILQALTTFKFTLVVR